MHGADAARAVVNVMARPVDAIVTGFTRNAELSAHAFAPLRQLRREGTLRDIHYVTWTSPELDAFVAPVEATGDLHVVRVPLPGATGNSQQKNLVYQVNNLGAALAHVPEDDALVVKLRPDFVFRPDFLREKILGFDKLCSIESDARAFGMKLPRPPFQKKVWVPWADANQPFFFEDAAFMGLKRDLALLVTPGIRNKLAVLEDEACGPFAHVLRWASVFLPQFPIFARYLAEYGAFPNDVAYRKTLIPLLLNDPFFWHLIVANAWILWTGFHIDCGRTGDLVFVANRPNAHSDWATLSDLKVNPPYDGVESWRAVTSAKSGLLSGVDCLYGRLTDDEWPREMFTRPHADVPVSTLTQIAIVLSRYANGSLATAENAFYDKLRQHHHAWVARNAA